MDKSQLRLLGLKFLTVKSVNPIAWQTVTPRKYKSFFCGSHRARTENK